MFGGFEQDSNEYLNDTWSINTNNKAGILQTALVDASLPAHTQLLEVNVEAQIQENPADAFNQLFVARQGVWTPALRLGQVERQTHEDGRVDLSVTINEPAQLNRLKTGARGELSALIEQSMSGETRPGLKMNHFEIRYRYDVTESYEVPLARCGDGILQPWTGEGCDDLNLSLGYCDADCSTETGSCGDGEIQTASGEVCDGELPDNRVCLFDCMFAACIRDFMKAAMVSVCRREHALKVTTTVVLEVVC